MDIVEEIKQKTDIVEIIGQYTKLTKTGKSLTGLCPFHSEKHGSFVVYPTQQSWHCYGACGTGGDVISFIMKKEQLSFGDAIKYLADRKGIVVPEFGQNNANKEKNSRIISANELAAEFYNEQLNHSEAAAPVREYLAKRGLTPQTIAHFRLGYSPKSNDTIQKLLQDRGYTKEEILSSGLVTQTERGVIDRFRGRLMFPIHDIKGQTVGFGARTMDNSNPKYLNSADTPIFSKSSLLYGLDYAKDAIRKEDKVIIVEGYMDVIVPHQYGYTNVIASMGTAIGESHCNILKKLTKNVVLALDADQAGEKGMVRTVPLENVMDNEIKMVSIPDGMDPDELMLKDSTLWPALIEKAEPIIDHIFDTTFESVDIKTVAGKSKAVDLLVPIIANISNPIRQLAYVDKLASITRVDKNAIIDRLNQNKIATYSKKPVESAAKSAPVASRPVESFCLSILIRHPDALAKAEDLDEEFFINSENKSILRYLRGQETQLDPLMEDYYTKLAGNERVDDLYEAKLEEVILRLREEYLKRSASAASELAISEGQALGQVYKAKDKLVSRHRSYYGKKESI
ncbi:MAG: DNA primase [Dehalococcoidales bacterium]|nr:DNA primase [Dehalococcoidales bacterium]